MWIIPSNHPLYSACAPDLVDSKEDLSELSEELEQFVTWKTKRLPLKTWCAKWSKVLWIQHLFGRMLKPSHGNYLLEKYISSLGDIHANQQAMPVKSSEKQITDGFVN